MIIKRAYRALSFNPSDLAHKFLDLFAISISIVVDETIQIRSLSWSGQLDIRRLDKGYWMHEMGSKRLFMFFLLLQSKSKKCHQIHVRSFQQNQHGKTLHWQVYTHIFLFHTLSMHFLVLTVSFAILEKKDLGFLSII